jgi:hypothetical protein
MHGCEADNVGPGETTGQKLAMTTGMPADESRATRMPRRPGSPVSPRTPRGPFALSRIKVLGGRHGFSSFLKSIHDLILRN